MNDKYGRFARDGFARLDAEQMGATRHMPAAAAVVASRPERLPFEVLPWERFERLVVDLIAREPGLEQAFVYGRPGQAQLGIDVVATQRETNKVLVAQCKRIKALTSDELRAWTSAMEGHRDRAGMERAVFVSSAYADDETALVQAWCDCHTMLQATGLRAELWHGSEICRRLRDQPEIVEHHFGPEVARAFCGSALKVRSYPELFADGLMRRYGRNVRIDKRSISLNLDVPDEENLSAHATLSFARSDLRGACFLVDGSTLVRWLQWWAHARSFDGCPFVLGQRGGSVEDGQASLLSPSAVLELDRLELQDFAWILDEAWAEYSAAAQAFETRWRTVHFPRLEGERRRPMFKLLEVDRWLWNRARNFADGKPPEEGDQQRARLYKVLDELGRAGLMGLEPGDGRTIQVAWTAAEHPAREGSSAADWDAERVQAWLLDELLPFLDAPVAAPQNRSRFRWKWWRRSPAPVVAPRRPPAARSLAGPRYRVDGLRFATAEEALAVASLLQRHFSPYQSNVPVEGRLGAGVLDALANVLRVEGRPAVHDHYIAGNLGLQLDGLLAGVEGRARKAAGEMRAKSFSMDFCLRSLAAALEGAELPPLELERVGEGLAPAWRRYVEDKICGAFR